MTESNSRLHDLLGKTVRVYDGARNGIVMGEGEVIAVCLAPTLTLKHFDGTRSDHSAELPREVLTDSESAPTPATSCSQCGQRTPVCVECGDTIIFVPRSGFGSQGEWRHLAPPKVNVGTHLPRPKVFVS